MVDQHGISVNTEILGKNNLPVVASLDGIVFDHRQIESDVVLLIDSFSVMDVCSTVRKERLHFRIAQLQERSMPQKLAPRVLRHFRNLGVKLPSQVAVDFDEILHGI